MPQIPSTPAVGGQQPKGTVDLFKAVISAQGKIEQDPAAPLKEDVLHNTAFAATVKSRLDQYKIDLPPSEILFRDWAEHPRYKGANGVNKELFDADYQRVHDVAVIAMQLGDTALKAYLPAATKWDSIGLYQDPARMFSEFGRQDPRIVAGMGTGLHTIGSKEESAARGGYFINRFGGEEKLYSDDLEGGQFGRNLVLESSTDQMGTVLGAPSLRELSRGETSFGKQMLSSWGLQKGETGPLVGLAASFLSELGPGTNNVINDVNRIRYQWLKERYEKGNGPQNRLTWEEALNTGNLPREFVEDLPRDAQKMYNRLDTILPQLDEFHQNEAMYRDMAAKGDKKAQGMVDMAHLFDGDMGDGFADKLVEEMSTISSRLKYKQSERAEQGTFSSIEGTADMIGQGLAFIVPQLLTGAGAASAITKLGVKGLVRRSALSGAQQLTKAGQYTVRGVASTVPTLQMTSAVYRSAREAGYSTEDAKDMAVMTAPMWFIAEVTVGAPWMIRKWVGIGGQAEVKAAIKASLPDGYLAGDRAAATGLVAKIMEKMRKAPMSRFGHAMQASRTEFSQESLEEAGYILSERYMDRNVGTDIKGHGAFGTSPLLSTESLARVAEAGTGGAIVGGIAGSLHGYQGGAKGSSSIQRMAAEKRGADILRMAMAYQKAGKITSDDYQAIAQEVAYSEDLVRSLGVNDPYWADEKIHENGLAYKYVKLNQELKEKQAELAALAEKDPTVASTEKAALEKQISSIQTEIDRFKSGEVALERYKQIYMISRARINGDAPRSVLDRFYSPRDIDRTISSFKSFIVEDQKRAEMALAIRSESMKDLVKIVADVKKGENVEKVLDELAAMHGVLWGKGAVTQKDSKDIQDELLAARKQLIGEFFKKRSEDPLVKSLSMDHDEAQMDEETVMSLFVEQMARPDAVQKFDDQDKKLLGGISGISGMVKSMQGMKADYRDEQHMDDISKNVAIVDAARRFFWSIPGAALQGSRTDETGRIPLERFISLISEKKTVLPEEAVALRNIISQQDLALQTLHTMRTSYPELAEKEFASRLSKLSLSGNGAAWHASLPPAQEQFMQDNQQIFLPLSSGIGGVELSDLIGHVKRLAQIGEEVAGRAMMRATSVDKFDEEDRKYRHRMSEMFSDFDKDMSKADRDKLNNVLATAAARRGDGDKEGERDALLRAEQIISNRMRASRKVPVKFLEHVYARVDWGGKEMEGKRRDYFNRSFMRAGFFEHYNSALLDKSTHDMITGSMITRVMNWISQLARVDQGKLWAVYGSAIDVAGKSDPIPTVEQEQRLLEVISRMIRPDNFLDESMLSTAMNKGTKERLARNTTLLVGHPGTGKTTMLLTIARALRAIGLQQGKKMSILLSATGMDSIRSVQKMIQEAKVDVDVTIATLDEIVGAGPSTSIDHDMVIIDEFQSMSNDQVEKIKQIANNNNVVRNWLLLGDPDQAPPVGKTLRSQDLPAWKFGFHTMPLNTSFRVGSMALETYLKDLRDSLYGNSSIDLIGRTSFDPEQQHGVELLDVSEPAAIYDRFIKDALQNGTAASTGDAFLIVNDKDQWSEAVAHLLKSHELVERLGGDGIRAMVRTMDSSANSVHGQEKHTVYIAFIRPDREYPKFLYTAASRAKDKVVAMFRGGRSEAVTGLTRITGDDQYLPLVRTTTRDRVQRAYESLGIDPEQAIKDKIDATPPGDTKPGFDGPQTDELPEEGTILTIDPSLHTFRSLVDFSANKGALPVFTRTMFYDEEFSGEEKQHQAPLWQFRKHQIRMATSSPSRVELRYQENEKFFTKDGGLHEGPAITVHLLSSEPEERAEAWWKNQYRSLMGHEPAKGIGIKELSLIGTIPITWAEKREKTANDVWMEQMVSTIRRANAGNNQVIPGYESLQIAGSTPGLIVGKQDGGSSNRPLKVLLENLKKKGFAVSRPQQRPAQYVGTSGLPVPTVVVDVRPYESTDPSITTRVFARAPILSDGFYQMLDERLKQYEDLDLRKYSFDRATLGGVLKVKGGTKDAVGVVNLLNNNRSSLVRDGEILQPILKQYFHIEEERFVFNEELDTNERVKGLRDSLTNFIWKNIGEEAKHKLYQFVRIRNLPDGTQEIMPQDVDMLLTDVTDVSMPHLVISVPSIARGDRELPEIPRSPLKRALIRAVDNDGARISQRQVIEYYRKIFGDKFINGDLEFKGRIMEMGDRELWGLMEDGRILISTDEGKGVRHGVERHEALHRVVNYLIDEPSKRAILTEAKERMYKETGRYDRSITDEDAEEYMAGLFEKHQDTNTLLGRFLRWFLGVLQRWNTHRSRIQELFNDIDSGRFKNMDHDDGVHVHRESPRISDIIGVEMKVDEPPTYGRASNIVLVEVFGSTANVRTIARDMRKRLLPLTQYAQPTEQSLHQSLWNAESGVIRLREAFEQKAAEISMEYDDKGGMEINGFGVVALKSINGEHISSMSDEQFGDYYIMKVGDTSDPGIYNGMINILMPGIRYNEPGEDDDTEMLYRQFGDVNDERDAFDRINGLNRMLITDMPMIHVARDGKAWETEEFMDNNVTQQVLIEASQEVQQVVGNDMDISKLINAYSQALLEIAAEDVGGAFGRYATSFHKRFLDTGGTFEMNGETGRSYAYALQYPLIATDIDEKTSWAIQERSKRSETILNGLLGLLTSITTYDIITHEVDVAGNMRNVITYYNGERRALDDLNSSTDRIFTTAGGGTMDVDQSIRSRFQLGAGNDPKAGHLFEIGTSNSEYRVADSRGKTLLKRSNSGQFEFTISQDQATGRIEPNVIVELISAFGYDQVSPTVVDRMINGRESSRLADMVGHWAMAFRSGVLQLEKSSETASGERAILDTRRAREGGISSATVQDISGLRDNIEPSLTEGKRVYRISDLFTINAPFARDNARALGSFHNRQYRSVTGKVMYSAVLGTPLRRRLNWIAGASPEQLLSHVQERATTDPAIIVNGKPFNPFMDPTSSFKMLRTVFDKGVKNDSLGKAASVADMTQEDAIRTMASTFYGEIFKEWPQERFMVPMHMLGDRDTIAYVPVEHSGPRILKLGRSSDRKRIVSVKLDKTAVDQAILNNFRYLQASKIGSIKRWMSVDASFTDQFEQKRSDQTYMEVVRRSNLILDKDYTIKNGVLELGNAIALPESDDRIYNSNNLQTILTSQDDPVALSAAITAMFEGENASELALLESVLKDAGVDFQRISQGAYLSQPENDRSLVRAFMYMHHLTDLWTSHLVQGHAMQYKRGDWIKRSSSTMTPGQMSASSPSGVGRHMSIAIREDISSDMLSGAPIAYTPGGTQPIAPVQSQDGGSHSMPWRNQWARVGFGGNEGVWVNTLAKTVLMSPDMMIKHAEIPVTAQSYRHNWLQRKDLFRALRHPILQKEWVDSLQRNGFTIDGDPLQAEEQPGAGDQGSRWKLAFDTAVADVMSVAMEEMDELGQPLRTHMIEMVLPPSSVKMGARNIASAIGDDPLIPIQVSSSDMLMVMNTERDLEDGEAPFHIQAEAIMGVPPTSADHMKRFRDIQSVMADIVLEEFADRTGMDVNTLANIDLVRGEEWLRSIAYDRIDPSSYMGPVADMLAANASINDPIIREPIMRFFSKYIKSAGINMKMNGQMYNSMPGAGIMVEEPLVETAITTDPEGNQAIAERRVKTLRRLKPPSIEGGEYVPGEVAMPFNYVKQFIPVELRSKAKYMTVDEVRQILIEREDAEIVVPIFEKSLDVFIGRIPLASSSAGSYMRVAAFINDQVNAIYVPPEINALAGSDHDADQWTVYQFNVVLKNGIPYIPTAADPEHRRRGLQNDMMQMFLDHYRETQNSQLYFSPTGVDRIIAFHAAKMDILPAVGRTPYSAYSAMLSHGRIFGAKKMIGQVALMNRMYGYLAQSYNAINKEQGDASQVFRTWTPRFLDSTGKPVINNINQLLNAALDDIKHMVVGDLGLTPDNVSLMIGMLLDGTPLEEALERIISSPAVEQWTRVIRKSSSTVVDTPGSTSLRTMLLGGKLPSTVAGESTASWKRAQLISETVAQFGPLFRLRKSMPSGDLEHTMAVRDMAILTEGDDVIKKLIPPWLASNASYWNSRREISRVLDHKGVIGSLQNVQKMMTVFNATERLYQGIFLPHNPFVRQLTRHVMRLTGMDPLNDQRQYNEVMMMPYEAIIARYMADQNITVRPFHGSTPIDLRTRDGMHRWTREFPDIMRAYVNDIDALPINDPRRQALMANKFIANLKWDARDGSLGIHDMAWMRDPIMRQAMVRDLENIDSALPKYDGRPMSEWLTIYSLIKDRMSIRTTSISTILHPLMLRGIDRTIDRVTSSLSTEQNLLSEILTPSVIDGFLAAHESLVPALSRIQNPQSGAWEYSDPRTPIYRMGDKVYRDQTRISNAVSGKQGITMDVFGSSTTQHPTLRWIDQNVYQDIARGEKSITIRSYGDLGLKENSPVATPYGTFRVTSVGKDEASIDASSMRVSPDGPAGLLYKKLHAQPAGTIKDTYFGGMFKDASNSIDLVTVLTAIGQNSTSTSIRSLANVLLQQERVSNRVSEVVFNDDIDPIAFGRYHEGHIDIWNDIPAWLAEEVVIHEAVHAFTSDVLIKPISDLSPHEADFVREIRKIQADVLALPIISTKYSTIGDVREFVAEIFASRDLQHDLADTGRGPKNLWQRIVSAIRNLLNSIFSADASKADVDNGIVGHLMTVLTDFVTADTVHGQFEFRKGGLVNKRKKRSIPDDLPIADIKDLTSELRNLSGVRAYDSMSDQQLIDHFVNDYDWSGDEINIAGGTYHGIRGMDRAKRAELVREKALPRITRFENIDKRRDLISALRSGGDMDAFRKLFPADTVSGSVFSARTIARLTDKMDHTPSVFYMLYSDLRDTEKELENENGDKLKVSDIGIPYTESLKGHDPIMQISKGANGIRVSIFDVTSTPFSRLQPGENRGRLFENHVPSASNENLSTLSNNDESGVRNLLLGLTMMGIKKHAPSIRAGGIASFSLGQRALENSTVWMPDTLRDVAILKKLPLAARLSGSIRSILDDSKLYEDIYKQSGVDHFYSFLRDNPPLDDEPRTIKSMRDNLLTRTERYLNGSEGDMNSLLDAMKHRQTWIENKVGPDDYLNPKTPHGIEYALLNQAISSLRTADRWGANTAKDIADMSYLIKNPHNVESDVVQWAMGEILTSMNIVSKRVRDFRREHDKKMAASASSLNFASSAANYTKNIVDVGWTQFEPLWKYSSTDDTGQGVKVRDADGKLVKKFLGELHWDKSDLQTRKMLESGELTEQALEYSNWLLDKVNDMYVRMRIHALRNDPARTDLWDPRTGEFLGAMAQAQAQAYVDRNWKRGLMPVVNKPASELLASKGVKDVLSAWWRKMSNVETVFEEDFMDIEQREMRDVANQFIGEISAADFQYGLGSQARMVKLGLQPDGSGGFQVGGDVDRNDKISHNLELVSTYFIMAGERQIVHESRSLPLVRAARSVLNNMKRASDSGQENNVKYLRRWARRLVQSRTAQDDRMRPLGIDIEPVINTAMGFTSMTRVSLSVPVAFASLIHNLVTSYGTAIANKAAGNDLFGPAELSKAMALYHSSSDARNKMAAISETFQLFEAGEREIANHPKYSRTRNLALDQTHMHFMSRWTDNMMRQIVAAAQMMNEGSWNAYTVDGDQLLYDVKKDRRFYDEAGKIKSDDARRVMDLIRDKLVDEETWGQSKEGVLKSGHSFEMGRAFKWIADKYVIGSMDAQGQVILNTYAFGRLGMQFKNFLPDKLHNAFGGRMSSNAGGRPGVMDDPVEGRKAYWIKRQTVGYMSAIGEAVSKLKEFRGSPVDAWKNMDEATRYSIARLTYDVGIAMALYLIYGYLSGKFEDDDERQWWQHDTPFVKKILQTAQDLLIVNPLVAIEQMKKNAIPAVDVVLGITDSMFGDTSRIKWNIPGYGTYRAFEQQLELAKDAP